MIVAYPHPQLEALMAMSRTIGNFLNIQYWKHHYGNGVVVAFKADNSPVTFVDRASDFKTSQMIQTLPEGDLYDPSAPVISEENPESHSIDVRNLEAFWTLDPLDGTKYWLKSLQEVSFPGYSYNLAYIRNGVPVIGIAILPAYSEAFVGAAGVGAWYETHIPFKEFNPNPHNQDELWVPCSQGSITDLCSIQYQPDPAVPLRVAVGKDTNRTSVSVYLEENFPDALRITTPNAFAPAAVIKGNAGIWPRFHDNTYRWDVAAWDAVLRAVGGTTVGLDGKVIDYRAVYETGIAYGKVKQKGLVNLHPMPGFVMVGADYVDMDLFPKTRPRNLGADDVLALVAKAEIPNPMVAL